MEKSFDLSSRIFNITMKIGDLVILNFIFIISCIPLVTIGASCTALYFVTNKMASNTDSYICRDFIKSFKSNFKQATVIWSMLIAIVAILTWDYYMITLFNNESGNLFLILTICIAAVTLSTAMYIFPVLSKFCNNTKNIIKNSILLSIKHFPITVIIISLNLIPIIIIYFNFRIFLSILFTMLIIGFAFISYLNSFLFNKIFDNYIDD